MRKEIKEFAEMMENTMKKHDAIKGESWKSMGEPELLLFLQEELKEYYKSGDEDELVDVANFCMMLWQKKKIKTYDGA